MNKSIQRIGILGLLGMLASPVVWPLGLGMKFMDITLENVKPGASFNLRVLKNLPMVVINQDTKREVSVVVESVIPNQNEVKEGYEPIPDPTWIKFLPARFELGPGASASADILITIPDDPKLVGHHYETIIWPHTEPKNKMMASGVQLAVGLRARLRMSIGTNGPKSLQQEKLMKKLAQINTDFSIRPDNLFVQEIPLGKRIDLKQEKRVAIKIINESDQSVQLITKSVGPEANNRPQQGYEDAPDPSWLQVQTPKNDVPGNSIKEVKLQLQIPDKPEYRGKKYMFLLQTSLANEALPLAYYNMVYVSILP